MVDKLRLARKLAAEGKSSKFIVRKTTLILEEAKAIRAAVRGVELRSNHIQILRRSLQKITQDLIPLAEAAYQDSPTGYNASAITSLSSEARCTISDIENLQQPETTALEIIQNIFQPFLAAVMRETVMEARKARTDSRAVCPSRAAEIAVDSAFKKMNLSLGVAYKGLYAEFTEKLGIVLKCDLQELRNMATNGRKVAMDNSDSVDSGSNERRPWEDDKSFEYDT